MEFLVLFLVILLIVIGQYTYDWSKAIYKSLTGKEEIGVLDYTLITIGLLVVFVGLVYIFHEPLRDLY